MILNRLRRLISPVYTKELVQIAVQKRGAWVRFLFLLTLFVASAITLWEYERYGAGRSAEMGRVYFTVLCVVQIIAAAILTPLAAGGAIAGEKEANTLGILMITRLTPRNIAQDKALSRITQMLYLNGMAFPFLALALLMGGIDWYHVVGAILYISATIIFCGGISVFFSSIRVSHVRAAASAYVYMFLFMILSGILGGVVGEANDSRLFAGAVNPAFGLAFLLEPYGGFDGAGEALTAAGLFLAGSIGVYIGCVLLAARVIKRAAEPAAPAVTIEDIATEKVQQPNPTEGKPSMRQRLTRPIRMKAARMLDPSESASLNPLIALKRLFQFAWKHKIVSILVIGFLGLPGVVEGVRAYRSLPFYILFYVFTGPIIGIAVLLKSATCFSQEKQKNRFPILAATRYRGPDVIKGTYRSIWHAVYPFVLLFVVVMVVGSIAIDMDDHYFNDQISIVFPIAFVVYVNFIIIIGMRVSLFCKTNSRAIAILAAILGGVCLWPVGLAIIADPFVAGDFEEALILSPAAMLGPGMIQHELSSAFERHPTLCTFHVALIIGASIGVYAWMYACYDRIVGRQPGMAGTTSNTD